MEGGSGPRLVLSSALAARGQNNRFIAAQHDAPPSTRSTYGITGSAVIWAKERAGPFLGDNAIENVGPYPGELTKVE